MPIYEFECPRCQHRFEELLKGPRSKSPACPECGCARPERLLSAFSMGAGSTKVPSSSTSACSTCSASSCVGCTR